jgi:hypothetical protein
VPFDARAGRAARSHRQQDIPETLEELKIEQAIAREALRLSFVQHRTFAVKLHGAQQARSIADAFAQGGSDSLVDLMKLDLLVGSGGVLSHAPRRAQSMLMMIDAFLVEGVTEIAVDSIFMMPHLGVLSTIHPDAATEVFEKDCLVRLGTCVATVGAPKRRAARSPSSCACPTAASIASSCRPASWCAGRCRRARSSRRP